MAELTVETMLDLVAREFQVAAQDIASEKDSQDVLEARYAFVYLTNRLVHADRMKKAIEENPEAIRRAGFAAMRHFTRQIYEELGILFDAEYPAVRHLDDEAIRLREEDGEYYKKTESLWAKVDEAYELGTGRSPVIWIDRVSPSAKQEGDCKQGQM